MFSDSEIAESYALAVGRMSLQPHVSASLEGLSFDAPFNDVAYSVARNRVIRAHRFLNRKCAACGADVAPPSKRRCAYHLKKERDYWKARRSKVAHFRQSER